MEKLLSKTRFHIFLVLFLGLLAYSNTLRVPFYTDDYLFLEKFANQQDTLSDISSSIFEMEGPWTSRPVLHATFALNYYFGGLDTRGYHAVNLLLHLLNGVLLYLLVSMTGKHLKHDGRETLLVALLASIIFTLHPLQTEAVTHIVNRSVLLVTTFYLLGFILFLRAVTAEKHNGIYMAALLPTAFLGMASRENFSLFPIILFLYDFFFISRFSLKEAARHWKTYLPVLASLAYLAFLLINHTYDRSVDNPSLEAIPPLQYILTQFNAHWTYLRLLILPINQNAHYDYPVATTLFGLPTILSFVGYAVLLAGSLFLSRKKPVASFGVLWMLITLIPISFAVALLNLRLGHVVFEHRFYLPSVGLYVLGASALVRFAEARRILLTAVAVITLVLGGAAYARNTVWADNYVFWDDVIKKSPHKSTGYNGIALYYKKRGLVDRAIEYYKTSLLMEPDSPYSHYNIAIAYQKAGHLELAMEHYREAIRLQPDYLAANNNLGSLYLKMELVDKAIESFKSTVRINPGFAKGYYNLGLAYLKANQLSEALEQFQKALELYPNDITYRNKVAATHYALGDYERAIREYKVSLSQEPEQFAVHNNLAIIYMQREQNEQAIEHLEAMLRIKPLYVPAHEALGKLYLETGEKQKAMEHFAIVLRLNPGAQQ